MLTETYRPSTLETFIGHVKAVRIAREMMSRGPEGTEAILITGATGCGKTTLARIIAGAWAKDMPVIEIDGDSATVEVVRDIRNTLRYTPMRGMAYLINEIHNLTPKAVQACLTLLESLPRRVVIIGTTSHDSGDLFGCEQDALLSRFTRINLSSQGLADLFAARAQEIARECGKDGQPIARYKRLVQDQHNNFRAVLKAIDAGEMVQGGEA